MESTLSHNLFTLTAEVAGYLGYSRTPANWTGWQPLNPYVAGGPDTQLGHSLTCVQAGLAQFYRPPLTPGETVAHKWSFLVPEAQLTLRPGVTSYDMPDDFGVFEGRIVYSPADNVWLTIDRTGIADVRTALSRCQGLAARPAVVTVIPKRTDGVTGQRFAALFAPTPDREYTVSYRYNVLPQALTAQNPYPYGGAMHGETIVESCLAVAESRFQDEAGVHKAAFMDRLQASIAVDVRDYRPEHFGYNGDRSRRHAWPYGLRYPFSGLNNLVDYNGRVS